MTKFNLRTMTTADIPFGLRLSAQNHWNQLDADWRRQLELEPAGCFVAERDGAPIGTACCCVFDDIAWINLVLVERSQRGQGVGTALMHHVLRYLDGRGVASVRLDATALGQPVYAKLGFAGDFTLTRYQGTPQGGASHQDVCASTPADLPAMVRWDETVTKTRRERLLRMLVETGRKFVVAGEVRGFCFVRPGANAWQIGPLAGMPDAGAALLVDAAQRFAGQPVYVDVPDDHAAAVAQVRALGLTPQRSFLRMTRGRAVREDLTRLWASFGPEKG